MDKKVEILRDEEIVIVDADEVFSTNEIELDDNDLDNIKDAEAQVARATGAIASAAKMQRRALDELENAEEVRQSLVRKLAAKYDIPPNKDWQINLASGKIVLLPENE